MPSTLEVIFPFFALDLASLISMKRVSCSKVPVVEFTDGASNVVFLNPKICLSFSAISSRNTFHLNFRDDCFEELRRVDHQSIESFDLCSDFRISSIVTSKDWISHNGL